ncbi:MAG TPA: GNAT family N-acetyltransferase, partial [Actinomycetota bacterium]|nr:GNAT family N-acetyltransferase [Actinomycetota bacterium]
LSTTDFAPWSTLVSEGSVPPATASTRRSSGPDRSLAATATLEDLRGEGYLRSVAVRPELRGKGVGTLMVAGALRHARERGLSRVWLLTESAEPFFGRLGFRTVGRDDLPESIRTSRQVAEGCAPSAVPMARDL